jgi:hypothetical protein
VDVDNLPPRQVVGEQILDGGGGGEVEGDGHKFQFFVNTPK